MQERGLARDQSGRRLRVKPHVTGDLATIGQGRCRFSRRQGAWAHRAGATLRPLFGPDTAVVSTQNGPWFISRAMAVSSKTCDSSVSIPVAWIASSTSRGAVVGSLAYFRDQHRRARSDQAHGREQDQLRRAGRTKSDRARKIAEPLIARGFRVRSTSGSVTRSGSSCSRTCVQPDQRADARDARGARARSGRSSVVRR